MKVSASKLAVCLFLSLSFVYPVIAQQGSPSDRQNDSSVGVMPARKSKGSTKSSATEPDGDDATLRWLATQRQYGVPTTDFKHASMRARAKRKAHDRAASGMQTGASSVSFASPNAGPTWIPIGPTGANYESNGAGSDYSRNSGRARKFLPHPTDPDTLYFLTSGGGLWVTHNFTASNTTWTPLTDDLPTTSGGSMAFGRSPQVIYLGTGDPFDEINFGGSMTKSVDGGETWSDPIDLGAALNVRDVLVDTSGPEDVILVATNDGLYRSADSGNSYVQVSGGVGQQFEGQVFWSLVQTSVGIIANGQTCAVAATGIRPGAICGTQSTMYLSQDLGANWVQTSSNWANSLSPGAGRTTLAVGAPGDSIVYAFAENKASTDQGDLYRSTDGGVTWTPLFVTSKTPSNPNNDNPKMDLMHNQSWYNQMILVDPRDASRNTIYLGGNLSSAKTTDGGNTWKLLSTWRNTLNGTPQFGLPYVHADFQTAAFTAVSGTPTLLFGNDGGIWVSKDDGLSWTSDKNNGLQTHLLYTVASTPAFPNSVFGGLQDNGTRVREGDSDIYDQSVGGDGIAATYSQNSGNLALTTLPGNAYRVQLENQTPEVFERWVNYSIGAASTVFFTPITIPELTASPTGKIFFTSSGTAIYKLDFSIDSLPAIIIGATGSNGIPATVGFRPGPRGIGVSPIDLLHIGVPGGSGHVELTANGGANWTDINMNAAVPGFQSFMNSVTYGDNNVIFVTSVAPLAGAVRVAKSTNGGSSWARADTGLPDVQVEKIYFDPNDPTRQTILAATYDGVYRSTDQGASWAKFGNGLPSVFVRDIYMPPNGGGAIRIATYGRGFWELPTLQFVSASLTDDVISCAPNGSLDNGETGTLTVTLRNHGTSALNGVTATVTSTNPAVSFPNGNQLAFAPAAASSTTTDSLSVALAGAVGIQQLDLKITYSDPSLALDTAPSALASFRVNADVVPHSSTSDDFGVNDGTWVVGGSPEILPDLLNWRYLQISPLEHRWEQVDANAQGDQTLTSPSLSVGAGSFSFAFQHRSFFGTSGMVIEISTDDGSSWTDIGAFATPTYDKKVTAVGSTLTGRLAYRVTAGWPQFVPVNVNLGTTYAGQNVRIRFRVGTIGPALAPGEEIRNFSTSGLTNTPFSLVQPHNSACQTGMSVSSNSNPSIFGSSVTFTASVTGGLNSATGSVDFSDGGTAIGSGTLDSGGSATFATSSLTVGPHTITATYAGDSGHSANSAQVSQTVNQKTAQTITFDALPDKLATDPDFSVSASASSGLTVLFGASGSCTVVGTTVHITGTGNCTITASQAGDATYEAATDVPQSFNIGKASQTITFGALANKNFGDADFSVSASATSGLTVSFGASGNCSVTGSTVHLTGAGSCTITASQVGDVNYSAAASVPQSFNIGKASQTITFGALVNKTFGDADFTVSASASSGLSVSFGASGNCSVTGSTVHLTASGSCSITASQAGSANFNAATPVTQTFSIAPKQNQTITFGALANKTYGNPDFTVSSSASSGLAVSFGASGNCSVSGNTVHLTGAGSCSITASQAGNGTYNPALPVTRSFSIAKANQTITFPSISKKQVSSPDFPTNATASSGLALSYSTSGTCTVTDGFVHITGGSNCTITASQSGNSNYNAAPNVQQSFVITGQKK